MDSIVRCLGGSVSTTRLLLERGADPMRAEVNGRIALHVAAAAGGSLRQQQQSHSTLQMVRNFSIQLKKKLL